MTRDKSTVIFKNRKIINCLNGDDIVVYRPRAPIDSVRWAPYTINSPLLT